MTVTEELLRVCRRLVDPDAHPIALHSGHRGTRALRAATYNGEVIVKIHRSPTRHARELRAYRNWATAPGVVAPRLLAHQADPPVLVVTALPGRVLAELDLPLDVERDSYRRAGRLLRAWHNAEPPRVEPNITTWLAERGERWLQLGKHLFTLSQRARIRAHLRALADLGAMPAAPCHLDFTPRNLIRTADGTVAVIDFEHARHDLSARDLVRLDRRVWSQRPDLRDAFLETYGRLSDLDREVIEHCVHLDAVTYAVRGAGHSLSEDDPAWPWPA